MKKSRDKGNNYELHICRRMSEWWFGKSFDKVKGGELPFRRTPLSGGWDKREGSDVNLMQEGEEFPFSIECKNQEKWSWDSLFKGGEKNPIWGYWEQCEKAAKEKNKVPLLIFSKNFNPDYVMMSAVTWGMFPDKKGRMSHIKIFMPDKAFVVTYMDELAKHITRKDLGY